MRKEDPSRLSIVLVNGDQTVKKVVIAAVITRANRAKPQILSSQKSRKTKHQASVCMQKKEDNLCTNTF